MSDRFFMFTDKSLLALKEAIGGMDNAIEIATRSGREFGLCYYLAAIQNKLRSIYRYELPTFAIRDHLKDCFGWLYHEAAP